MFENNANNFANFKDLGAPRLTLQPSISGVSLAGGKFAFDVKSSTQIFFDRFAIGLSVLCAIHCLAVPVLLIMFPSLLASFHIDDHIFHELLIWVAVPTSSIAFFLGCRRHKDPKVFALAGLGLASLIATAFFGHDALGEMGEKLATLFAVSILAYAHWRNYSLCRKDSCEH